MVSVTKSWCGGITCETFVVCLAFVDQFNCRMLQHTFLYAWFVWICRQVFKHALKKIHFQFSHYPMHYFIMNTLSIFTLFNALFKHKYL